LNGIIVKTYENELNQTNKTQIKVSFDQNIYFNEQNNKQIVFDFDSTNNWENVIKSEPNVSPIDRNNNLMAFKRIKTPFSTTSKYFSKDF